MDKNDLILELKPKYKIPYIIITHFWDIFILGIVLIYIGSQPKMLFNTICATIVLILIFLCFLLLRRKHYNRLYFYRFYSDRLRYRDRYFSKKIKEIKYKNIKEIKYNQTFTQSRFKIGEITLITNDKNLLKKVVFLKAIPNVEKNFERIGEILDKKDDINGTNS